MPYPKGLAGACACAPPGVRRPTVACAIAAGRRPYDPCCRRRVTRTTSASSKSPGCTERSPGFLFFKPRWRNRHTRMFQKHGSPGSNPGWGTRFRREQSASVPLRHSDRMKRNVLLQLGMWPIPGGHGSTVERDVASVEMRVRSSLPAPKGSLRLMVRTAAFQAADAGSIPAGNISRCSAAGQRAPFGTGRPQVRILPARPTIAPVAQGIAERAVTAREVEGSNPSGGAIFERRCNSAARVLACRARSRGFDSRQRRHDFTARNSTGRVADS